MWWAGSPLLVLHRKVSVPAFLCAVFSSAPCDTAVLGLNTTPSSLQSDSVTTAVTDPAVWHTLQGTKPSARWHPAATLCWSHMSIPAQISIAQWWLHCPSAQQHFLSIFISPAYCQGWAWGRKICLLTFRQLVWRCTTHIKPVGCVGSFHLLRPHWEISVVKAKESFRLY